MLFLFAKPNYYATPHGVTISIFGMPTDIERSKK